MRIIFIQYRGLCGVIDQSSDLFKAVGLMSSALSVAWEQQWRKRMLHIVVIECLIVIETFKASSINLFVKREQAGIVISASL